MASIPPPPPLSPVSVLNITEQRKPGGTIIDDIDLTHYMAVGQLGLHEYRQQCERDEKTGAERVIYLSYYRSVVPIIQSGPVCGFVAVAMAAPLVQAKETTTEKLLKMAIEQGVSKQGEIFSASNMCSLVLSLLIDPVSCEVIENAKQSQIMQFVLQGDLLLIPYDSDKNYSPCHKKGHKAHWMLITGGFFAVNNTENIISMSQLEENEDYYERGLFHLRTGKRETKEILRTLSENTDKIVSMFVYGHQGKSKQTGVWTIPELLSSNAQLTELGPERASGDYIVPNGGLQEGLCGQIVRIFSR